MHTSMQTTLTWLYYVVEFEFYYGTAKFYWTRFSSIEPLWSADCKPVKFATESELAFLKIDGLIIGSGRLCTTNNSLIISYLTHHTCAYDAWEPSTLAAPAPEEQPGAASPAAGAVPGRGAVASRGAAAGAAGHPTGGRGPGVSTGKATGSLRGASCAAVVSLMVCVRVQSFRSV